MKKFIGDNGGGTPNLGESKDNVFFKNEEKAKLQTNEREKYFQRADKTVFSDGGGCLPPPRKARKCRYIVLP